MRWGHVGTQLLLRSHTALARQCSVPGIAVLIPSTEIESITATQASAGLPWSPCLVPWRSPTNFTWSTQWEPSDAPSLQYAARMFSVQTCTSLLRAFIRNLLSETELRRLEGRGEHQHSIHTCFVLCAYSNFQCPTAQTPPTGGSGSRSAKVTVSLPYT